jgi:hypothetical protein
MEDDKKTASERARAEFQSLATRLGWAVKVANTSNDEVDHRGFLIEKNTGISHLVQVRSRKRIRREDSEPQDNWQWVELHGVNPNDQGWLFGRNTDWIAFETNKSFILVDKQKLIKLVKESIDTTSLVLSPGEAKYRVYSRKNRFDAITLIETEKLNQIAEETWDKLWDN